MPPRFASAPTLHVLPGGAVPPPPPPPPSLTQVAGEVSALGVRIGRLEGVVEALVKRTGRAAFGATLAGYVLTHLPQWLADVGHLFAR